MSSLSPDSFLPISCVSKRWLHA
ncbi:hypothetical protein [Dickeya oryzae]|uniref:Uncharacterized protein n=1 Tax=Dickeya oryzae TaxID=1240404 RepID=A0AB39IL61_9GAMM